ncbi:MAG: fatty acid desaturase family protein [Cyanobacteria bacterium J06643_13]
MVSDIQSKSQPNKAQDLLSTQELKVLNTRSNLLGILQLIGHLSVMAVSGYLWLSETIWLIKIPALIIYGFSLASMFAVVHECSHRTAFANNRLNDAVAWCAGVLSGYNSTFYRRYHKWHHRYTRIEGKDPELEDIQPSNLREYLAEISGYNWWLGKLKTHYRVCAGKLDQMPYISESARSEVINSNRWQIAVYGLAIAFSLIFQQPWFITLWLLPLAVGQPILRFILLVEHTGCSYDNNPLANTRTTLTWLPIKFMMWNMPFHAEHHLYPSLPFHALPQAHQELKEHFTIVDDGYLKVNQNIISSFQ